MDELRGTELLRRVWERIKARPERWAQDSWVSVRPNSPDVDPADPFTCGTTACVAGHAVFLAGAALLEHDLRLIRDQWELHDLNPVQIEQVVPPPGYDGVFGVFARGTAVEIPDLAADLLGLNPDQADRLFSYNVTEELLDEYVKALLADPNADLEPIRVRYFAPAWEDGQ
jgi:hypothetical protein